MSEFKEKKQEIENMMKSFIVRKSSSDFRIVGKTERLGEYFGKRREFTDLYLGSNSARQSLELHKFRDHSEHSTEEEPHFMTELNVKMSTI